MNKWHLKTSLLSKTQRFVSVSAFIAFTNCPAALALPEDAALDYVIASGSSEILLNENIILLSGTEEEPAVVTQGSRILSGLQIRIEGEGESSKLTASGKPARFQQQLQAGQEPVFIRGLVLVFDQDTQMLTIDGEGEFEKAGLKASNHHFDYDLQAGKISAPANPNGEQYQMLIPNSSKE